MRLPLAAALLALAATPAWASSVEGLWQAPDDGAQIQLDEHGDELVGRAMTSGRIQKNPDMRDTLNPDPALRSRMLKGVVFMTGFKGGPKSWTGGRLYKPDDGKTYTGKITLVDANTLKLQGCIVYPLCKTQTWKRIR